jgi:hypothetical protein
LIRVSKLNFKVFLLNPNDLKQSASINISNTFLLTSFLDTLDKKSYISLKGSLPLILTILSAATLPTPLIHLRGNLIALSSLTYTLSLLLISGFKILVPYYLDYSIYSFVLASPPILLLSKLI